MVLGPVPLPYSLSQLEVPATLSRPGLFNKAFRHTTAAWKPARFAWRYWAVTTGVAAAPLWQAAQVVLTTALIVEAEGSMPVSGGVNSTGNKEWDSLLLMWQAMQGPLLPVF